MTKEEKQKAIDALKISAPVIAVTQEEFKDYIQSLNKIMDWLEQEPTDKKITKAELDSIVKAINEGWELRVNESLEKIKADLYKLYNDRPSDYNHSQRTELFCEVIKIIDKYKAETEET